MSEKINARLVELEEQSQNLDKAWEEAFAAVGEASRTMRRIDHEAMMASLELQKLQEKQRQWKQSALTLRGLNAEMQDLRVQHEKGEVSENEYTKREENLLRWIGAEMHKQQQLENSLT